MKVSLVLDQKKTKANQVAKLKKLNLQNLRETKEGFLKKILILMSKVKSKRLSQNRNYKKKVILRQ